MILEIFWGTFLIVVSSFLCWFFNAYGWGFALALIFTLLIIGVASYCIYNAIQEKDKTEIIKQCVVIFVILFVFAFATPLKIEGDFSEHMCEGALARENGSKYACASAANGSKNKSPLSFKFEYYCTNHSDHWVISEKDKEDTHGNDKYDAWAAAIDVVKSQLKAPSTAKFDETKTSLVDNSWIVTGTVDAQNSFGVSLRNNFTVKITFIGKGKFIVDQCTIN